jgi:hypothetical protein
MILNRGIFTISLPGFYPDKYSYTCTPFAGGGRLPGCMQLPMAGAFSKKGPDFSEPLLLFVTVMVEE